MQTSFRLIGCSTITAKACNYKIYETKWLLALGSLKIFMVNNLPARLLILN